MKDARLSNSLLQSLTADPVQAARRLLGCELVLGGCRVRIVETEGYRGADDPGSHSYRGQTKRNAVMFGPVGVACVYFVYGNHWMLNVVAHQEGEVGAVLLRAARPLDGKALIQERRGGLPERDWLNGPGKLCQALKVTGALTGTDLLAAGILQERPPIEDVLAGKRVGLAEGKGNELPWRFVLSEDLEWSSRPRLRST